MLLGNGFLPMFTVTSGAVLEEYMFDFGVSGNVVYWSFWG